MLIINCLERYFYKMKNQVIKKINNLEITIGIIGLGYVGLPLMLSFVESGNKTIGFDIDNTKVEKIKAGVSYLKHLDSERIQDAIETGKLDATCDFSEIKNVDVVIMCVPTPLNKYREPDMSFIVNTIDTILPYIHEGQLISLESTTYPGTTDEIIKPKLESRGLIVGKDIFLVFSPEREDPGNQNYNTRTIPKVIGGITTDCLEVGVSVYSRVIDTVIPVSSAKAAELTKLLENIYRAVNIGLVNEMKIVADKMGIDIWEVINAAATKPFGFTPFYPGPGWGGHCIPIDPFYLTWKAKEYGINTKFIELAGEINTSMPQWVVDKTVNALNEHQKSLKGSKILIMGISYKKNIDDMRESPSVKIMELLREKGAEICYCDPYVPVFPKMREHHFDLSSVGISKELLNNIDCAIIATDHDVFEYDFLLKNCKLIIDTRGRFKENVANVIKC